MIWKKRSTDGITVPANGITVPRSVYRHLQGAFASGLGPDVRAHG